MMWNLSIHAPCLKLLLILLSSQGIPVTDQDPVVQGGVRTHSHTPASVPPLRILNSSIEHTVRDNGWEWRETETTLLRMGSDICILVCQVFGALLGKQWKFVFHGWWEDKAGGHLSLEFFSKQCKERSMNNSRFPVVSVHWKQVSMVIQLSLQLTL